MNRLIWGAALLLTLVFSAETDACWRGRPLGRCGTYCGPCYPRSCQPCMPYGRDDVLCLDCTETGQTCWCCKDGTWIPCKPNCGCDPNTLVCDSQQPVVVCPNPGTATGKLQKMCRGSDKKMH